MATPEESTALFVTDEFQANISWAISEILRKIYADPREDTSNPPYRQDPPNPDERQALARDILYVSGQSAWIGRFGSQVLAKERATPLATLQGFTADDWLDRCENITDELAESFTDQP